MYGLENKQNKKRSKNTYQIRSISSITAIQLGIITLNIQTKIKSETFGYKIREKISIQINLPNKVKYSSVLISVVFYTSVLRRLVVERVRRRPDQ